MVFKNSFFIDLKCKSLFVNLHLNYQAFSEDDSFKFNHVFVLTKDINSTSGNKDVIYRRHQAAQLLQHHVAMLLSATVIVSKSHQACL